MALSRRLLLASLPLTCPALAAGEGALELSGTIAPPSPRRLTLSALDAMGRIELVTHTPWTQGPQHFGGMPLGALFAAVQARGDTVRAVALNDYTVAMPRTEVVATGGFLAWQQDGAPMPIRQRGPFWIVFPWSARPEVDTALTRQRSVWQLQQLIFA